MDVFPNRPHAGSLHGKCVCMGGAPPCGQTGNFFPVMSILKVQLISTDVLQEDCNKGKKSPSEKNTLT